MMDETIIEAALAAEKRTGVAAAVLLAVAEVESGARPFALVDGRPEPLIRFEGHWFDRLLTESKRDAARKAGLAAPKAGAVRNPASQAARWKLLRDAAAIDREAAYAATSWGLGQIMGFHAKRLGFPTASILAEEARGSAEGQFVLVARFLKLGDLDKLVRERRFADFARAYNGPGFQANRYDAKIRQAHGKAEQAILSARAPIASVPPSSPDTAKTGRPGWADRLRGLSAALRWKSPPHSTPADTRSFSTSTERSSASPTTPPMSR